MVNSPLIITCAVTGAELTKKDYAKLPVTPSQIARSARDAVRAGASIIHLHVRDEKGIPTQRVDVFQEVTEKIREQCDCIIQYSTGGAVGTPVDQRCAPLNLRPDMASLSLGTLNFGGDIFENSESTIIKIAKVLKRNKVMPEVEIFDAGMLDTMERFLKKGLIPKRHHINFVLGVPGGMGGEVEDLIFLKEKLRSEQTWSVSGIGRFQLPLTAHVIGMEGHVRVGLEDNIYYRKGVPAKSNAQFIKRVVRIANELERPVAIVKQARCILGI